MLESYPEPENIFKKWLDEISHDVLKKNYKTYLTKTTTEGLTFADTVQDNELIVVAKIQIQEKTADMESREPKHVIAISNTNSKGPYYEFAKPIEYENWKGKPFTKLWKSIKPYNCPECSGKGYSICDCDKGHTICKHCSGKGNVPCNDCNAKGEKNEQVSIVDGLSGKKRHEVLSFSCESCYGQTIITCSHCSGLSHVAHSTCQSSGKLRCKDCRGTGKLVDILEDPVPIKPIIRNYIYSGYSEEDNNNIAKILIKKKFLISKIDINSLDDIETRDIKNLIREPSKNIEKFLKNLNKEVKGILKNKNETVLTPISIFSGVKLNCKSTKTGNFEIVSFGDMNDFSVLSIGLKS